MGVFTTTLEQILYLMIFIVIGYFLAAKKFIPQDAETTLSKLETYIFVPALVLDTFMENFNVGTLGSAWQLLLGSLCVAIVFIAVSAVAVRFCSKDKYIRNIFLYGLAFSNFGFMGNAVVKTLFPDIFLEYLIFTLPLWALIYVWGVPILILGDTEGGARLTKQLKNFLNPMFICMVIGIIIGLSGIEVPSFMKSLVSSAGACMSPIAMLLTGMTVARVSLGRIIKIKNVYAVTAIRLLVYPLIFIVFRMFVPLPETLTVCALCTLAMPLGLNTIVIPAAYGKDTTTASAMALISHVFSCFTIPLIFMIFNMII